MSDNKIVMMPGKGPTEPPAEIGPVKEVVDLLCDLLIEAQKGNIRAIGCAIVKEKGHISTAYAYGENEGTCNQMAAAISFLQHRFLIDQVPV